MWALAVQGLQPARGVTSIAKGVCMSIWLAVACVVHLRDPVSRSSLFS